MGSSPADTQRDIAEALAEEKETYKVWFTRETPQHAVTIGRSFAMGRYLVTRGEFASFVQETGYAASQGCIVYDNHWYPMRPRADWRSPGFTQTDRDPVVCVSWNDAQAYVAWLNSKLGRQAGEANGKLYHLPSEAEWEYSARSGTQTIRWWGDAIGKGNADCLGCGSQWDNRQPSPVASFRPNPFGLFDMLGSAWEWTQDCWHENYIEAPTDGAAWMNGESCGRYYAARGGSFSTLPWILRPAHRTLFTFNWPANDTSFRVAKRLP